MFLLIGALFLLYALYLTHIPKESQKRKALIDQLPGPRSYPIIGAIPTLMTLKKNDRLKQAELLNQEYGPLYKVWVFNYPVVNVMKPDDAEVILASSKNIDKAKIYRFFNKWLGTGLLTSQGQKWHERRKMLTPAFHFSILETFLDVFIENSNVLIDLLEKELGKEFDMFPYISNCALDIICESAMGVKVNTQKGASRDYLDSVRQMTELITDRIMVPMLYFRFVFKRSENYLGQKKALKILHGMSKKLIVQRKLQRVEEKDKTKDMDDDFLGRKKKKAFLDLLLDIAEESQGKLSDEDIREEVDTFMFEGHDTTAAALVWTIYLLGKHPEIQENAYEELTTVFGSLDYSPTMKELSELKYLECVIKETLRLFPSVPFIGRCLSQDIKLSGYEIPSGTTVLIHLTRLQRQSSHFTNPDTFNPDNFAVDVSRRRHPFSYAPFSAGPRNCIGQKFAMLEMKTVLSTFIRRYKVESLQSMDELAIIPDTILRPSKGVHVKITKRCELHN